MNWKNPVAPIMTNALLDELVVSDKNSGPKATAFDTPLRFSSAGDCARALSYQVLGAKVTNPFDAPSVWVTTLGTLIHEKVQEAIERRFPGTTFENKAQIEGVTSGHCDGLADGEVITAQYTDWDGGKVLYELKTMGGFSFEKSIGLRKQSRKMVEPEGPRYTAVLQAALNAYANECDTIIIGHISLEGISKGVAAAVGLNDTERTIAEWHIPKEVWLPLALGEIERQKEIVRTVREDKVLAGRIILDDEGTLKAIDPSADRPFWKCDYCSYKDLCIADGSGIVSVAQTVAIRKGQ